MNTTRAMLILGIVMLVLAVIVAQGLRPDQDAPSGSSISGTISKSPEPRVESNIPQTEEATAQQNTPKAEIEKLVVEAKKPEVQTITGKSPEKKSEKPAEKTSDQLAVKPVDKIADKPVEKKVEPSVKAEEAKKPAKVEDAKKTAPASKTTKQVVTTQAPKELAQGQKAIVRARLEQEQQSFIYRFSAADKIGGKAFTLKEPERLVVDLKGSWGINIGKIPTNKFLKSIRVGKQGEDTRLVFDLTRLPKQFRLVQVDAKTLELQAK